MSDAYAEDFFVVNRWMLRCAGMWRPETKNENLQALYSAYVTGTFLFVNIFFTSTEFLSLAYTFGNEYDFIKNVSFLLTHLMGAVKVIFFYFQGTKLKKIMSTLESPELQYRSCPEKNFFPGAISGRFKKMGIRYSLLFFMLAHATLTSSYLPPLVAAAQHARNPEKPLPERLPYYSWMPFRFDTARLYMIALGYQAIPMFSYAYSIVGMDTLFMNIMNCIGMNLEIVQGAFLTVRERASENIIGLPLLTPDGLHNSEKMRTALNDEMKKISRHLQIIYKMCDDLENVYKFLTLAQTIATLFILCSCLYLVSTTPADSKQFLSEIVYMIAMGFQLVLYCWFGNEVTLKADKVPFYIWQCDWISADKEFKTSMIVTMVRSKRPLYLTAGKFAPLTLPTFIAIIKASYSFYTVIKNTSN